MVRYLNILPTFCDQDGTYDLSAPPFTLADLRNAIPKECWQKDTVRSMAFLALDVAIVVGLAAAAVAINQWWVLLLNNDMHEHSQCPVLS